MIISTERRNSQMMSFGIFKPEEGWDIDDAVAHMSTVASLLEKTHNLNVAILRSLDFSWAAVFAAYKDGSQNEEKSAINLPEVAAFTRGLKCAMRIVDSGWFRLSSQQTVKGVPFAELLLGDIVSMRRIYCSWKRQDILSYSCLLAILRSYFTCFKGIISASFFDSLDRKQIIGFGVWDKVESALAVEKNRHKNPALAYWKDVGAKGEGGEVPRLPGCVCYLLKTLPKCNTWLSNIVSTTWTESLHFLLLDTARFSTEDGVLAVL